MTEGLERWKINWCGIRRNLPSAPTHMEVLCPLAPLKPLEFHKDTEICMYVV